MSNNERSWYSRKYEEYYTAYVPWLEDKVLAWFGENKTSYTTKEQLRKTEITGDKNIDAIQDGAAEGVGSQLAKGGCLAPVGEGVSKEGVNRAGKGDTGPLDTAQAKQQQSSWAASASNAFSGEGEGVMNAGQSVGG
ncbi:MAG: hypothetical protein Q9191_001877 [Dirinaria sp. TL-2023a]